MKRLKNKTKTVFITRAVRFAGLFVACIIHNYSYPQARAYRMQPSPSVAVGAKINGNIVFNLFKLNYRHLNRAIKVQF
jgi:hypothetical protein